MRKVNAEGTERKKRKKWPIIVVVIIGLFLLAAAGGGSSDDNTSGSSGTQTQNDIKHSQSEQAAAETVQDSEEEDTENPKSKGYTVGETWKNKYISVSYLEAGEYTDYSEYFSPADVLKLLIHSAKTSLSLKILVHQIRLFLLQTGIVMRTAMHVKTII